MNRSRWLVGLLLLVVGALGLAAGCGSGGSDAEPQPTTARAERDEREQMEPVETEQGTGAVAESDDGEGGEQEGAAARRVADERRAGLMVARNVVGDPDAPVVIVEYSDFQ